MHQELHTVVEEGNRDEEAKYLFCRSRTELHQLKMYKINEGVLVPDWLIYLSIQLISFTNIMFVLQVPLQLV